MIIHSKSDDVVFLPLSSWNEFKPNIEEICKVFNTLSLNSSPRFCRSIIHNQRKLDGFEDIGTDVFAINKILFKSVFSVSIVDRNYPLIEGLEKWLNYQTCYALCLPVPKPIGIFSIKKES